MAESTDTNNVNAIGKFRPTDKKLNIHAAESTGTYRQESAIGFPRSPTSPMNLNGGMESRLLQKEKKKSIIG
jgi:hypothetical protein